MGQNYKHSEETKKAIGKGVEKAAKITTIDKLIIVIKEIKNKDFEIGEIIARWNGREITSTEAMNEISEHFDWIKNWRIKQGFTRKNTKKDPLMRLVK